MTAPKFCTIDSVRTALLDPLGIPDPGPDVVAQATAEVYQLASEAYVREDPAARGRAERVLHLINSLHHFAPPVQAVPAVIWGVLSRALLDNAFRKYGGAAEMSPKEMAARLEAKVQEVGCQNHPLDDEMMDPKDNRPLTVWAKNWFGSTFGFSVQLTALSMHCPTDSRRIVLENMADEMRGTTHRDMRARFTEAIGLKYDAETALQDPDRLTESFALSNYRTAISSLSDCTRGLGAFFSIERNWPVECMKLVEGFRKRGMSEEAIEVFNLHATTDVEHSAEWLSILEASNLTPPQCAKVVDGAVAQLNVRRRMYDAMRSYLYGR